MFKNKKKNLNILIYFFLLTILMIGIFVKTPGLKGGIDQEIRILTNNPIIIDGRFPLKESLPNIKIAFLDLFNFKKKKYETIKIDMKYKNFNLLKEDRSKALKLGMLRNPSMVNFDLIWKGKKISASGRLKGDFNDHRNFNKQWSLKLNLKNSKTIMGMSEFSITNHRSRNFPYNFIISKNLSRMGLHVPKFETVKVNFNGNNWGIMLIEEHFTKEFLETRRLKNNLIFKLSDEQIVKFQHLYNYKQIIDDNEFNTLTKWQDKFNVYYHNEKKLFKKKITYEKEDFIKKLSLMKTLNENLNIKKENISEEIIEKYFDLKSFATMVASSLAWGEGGLHSMELNNVRFYINPYTLKITPIPADYEFIFQLNEEYKNTSELNDEHITFLGNKLSHLPPFYQSIFLNKKFQNFYIDALNEFEKNLENIYNDTSLICSNYNKICNKIVKLDLLKLNISTLKILNKKIFDAHKYSYNYYTLNNNLIYSKYLKENDLNKINYYNLFEEHIYARLYKNGLLKIINLTNCDLYIDSIEFEGSYIKKKINLKMNGSRYGDAEVFKLNLNFNPKINTIAKINYSFKRNTSIKTYQTFVENNIDLLHKNENFYDFTKNEILIENKNIIFKGKKYIINKPIYVPEDFNLVILDGAELLFSENAYILVNKGSIKIFGKKDKYVKIAALNEKWGGIHVIGNKEKSEINYTYFSKVDFFKNDKFNLTGGINFYNSDVKINNSSFNQSFSEDYINFIKSKFEINNSYFSKIISDGIDSDYSTGSINNSNFKDIDGDAIDTSGSMVNIISTKIINVADKGISVGEDSKVHVSNILIDNASIGIASKDSSEVYGNNISIQNSKTYDLASYNKKNIYGGGFIDINKIDSSGKYLSQKNSIIKVNEKIVKEEKFKTELLY